MLKNNEEKLDKWKKLYYLCGVNCFCLTMGKYINSINESDLNSQKVDFMIKSIGGIMQEQPTQKPSFSLTMTWQRPQSPNSSPYITRT